MGALRSAPSTAPWPSLPAKYWTSIIPSQAGPTRTCGIGRGETAVSTDEPLSISDDEDEAWDEGIDWANSMFDQNDPDVRAFIEGDDDE